MCYADGFTIRPMAVWLGLSLNSERWTIGATRQYYPKPAPIIVPLSKIFLQDKDPGPKKHHIESVHLAYIHVIIIY